MTIEETRKAREVMQHFENGGEVEYTDLVTFAWVKCDSPTWNWGHFDYRIAKPEPVSIPITEAEKGYLDRITIKNKINTGISMIRKDKIEDFRKDYYFLNPKTQCWEEWSEELERELMK